MKNKLPINTVLIASFSFVLGIFIQDRFNLIKNNLKIVFNDFPETKQGEMGLPSKYDLSNKQFGKLIESKKIIINNNLYELTASQYLDDGIIGYSVEVNDASKVGQPDTFPIVEGLIVHNQKSGRAIQFYDMAIQMMDFTPHEYLLTGKLYLPDINNDKLKEFAITTSSGGNSLASSKILIFQITQEGKYKLLNPNLDINPHLNISGVSDIDQDGIYELIVTDDDWEISSCTDHASGPITVYIYSWNNEKGYIENSSKYPKYYQDMIARDISKECSGKKDFCFGPALQRYFAYKQMGKEKEGWTEFLRMTNGVSDSMWPSKTCLKHVINLHNSNQTIVPPNKTTEELFDGG